ncbi:MAG: hypothetical protein JW746_00930 [Candidatus Krumholzibacteriota bacterium]|nr:hypothetical protein [Candidatus Krumholzibacteriota bacterium]
MDYNERGYVSEPDRFDFSAKVVKSEDAGDGNTRVWLEKTFFYPFSGGQPDDRGTLNGIEVTEVSEDENGVCHLVGGIIGEGDIVEGRVDPERRRDHMCQHSGQHLLSRIFLEKAGFSTVGFHMGERISTIDLDNDNVTDDLIEEVEISVNRLVLKNIPFSSRIITIGEYTELIENRNDSGIKGGIRSRIPEGTEMVRIVEIDGIDSSTCCGTHVQATGEIGSVKILGREKVKNGTRLQFVCGLRAAADYRGKHDMIDSLARKFSTDWSNIEKSIEKLYDENRTLRKEAAALNHELAEFRVREIEDPTDHIGDYGVIRKIFDQMEPGVLRDIAGNIREKSGMIVLFGYRKPSPGLIFASSAGIDIDMGEILKTSAGIMGARGGGSKNFAQGGGGDEEKVEGAVDEAFRILKEKLK